MKWFKKSSSSALKFPTLLKSRKQELNEDLKNIQNEIAKLQSFDESSSSSAISDSFSSHLDEDIILKKNSVREDLTSSSLKQEEIKNISTDGKIDLSIYFRKLYNIFSLNDQEGTLSQTEKQINTISCLEFKKTRREKISIRRRLYLLIFIFILITWGVFLMFFIQ